MVSKVKKRIVDEISQEAKIWSLIGLIDMSKTPARQIHEIRSKLRQKAKIKMVKKRLIPLIFKKSGLKGVEKLEEHITGEPALLFSKESAFKLARIILDSKSPAPARPGDIAPRDIVIPAGPTTLPPGPAIGELQKAKIPAGVEGDKIVVKQDTVVAKEGDEISKETAEVLAKLGVQPMEIWLNLVAVWENGLIYPKETLFITQETWMEEIAHAQSNAFKLSLNINYITKENIELLLSKAHSEAMSLAALTGVPTKETIIPLLLSAKAQAGALEARIGGQRL